MCVDWAGVKAVQPPTILGPEARIDLGALARNADRLLGRVRPRGLLAVVKWNAYGHGLVPCSKVLDEAGAAGFGVSSPAEGIALRKAGITKPILVMTDWVGKPPKQFLDWDLEAAATSWYKVEYLESVSRVLGRPIPTHVKFDTGLGRVGIHHSQASQALRKIARLPHLKVVGLYSHLGYNGPRDHDQGLRQIEVFNRIVAEARLLGMEPRWIHLANSAAALAIPDVPGNMVRTGIALYGQPPSPEVRDLLPLEPVMTLVGRIGFVRRVRRGHGFPDPLFWKAQQDGWGAEVRLGHRIGYPRSLAGRASALFRGKRQPVVGIIGEDICYLFCGSDRPEMGEEVVFWGKQKQEFLYLYELAPLIGALPYELPTWLSGSLPRVFGSPQLRLASEVHQAA
ncbi:alanine racemase [bacterium]|nr:alanine racemase [bacterium]MBU1984660.1 alanine racemase [bacterium]